MAATIKDIREKTGLSLATISKYLNGGNVLPENRLKIEAAIKELHYEVNELARSLVTSKTKTVGVVAYSVESLYTGILIRYIGEALRRVGYGLLICDSDQDGQVERENISFLLSKKVDGIIIIPVSNHSQFLRPAKDAGIPIVLVDRKLEDESIDCVSINNRGSAQKAVELLIKNGHQRIAVITSDRRTYTGWERYLGYEDAMRNAGCPLREEYIKCGDHSIEYGHSSMEQLLTLPEPPTGVFMTNYELSLGAVMALNESGKLCPDDVSLVGFDNLLMNHVVRPKLYMVVQPMKEIGEEAVRLMLNRISSKEESAPIDIVLGARIKEGNSIKKLS